MTYFGSKLLTYRLRQKEGVSKLKGLLLKVTDYNCNI
mgnify:CR=1 FL=1